MSGRRGSATFFFSHCPLCCKFCQNFPISQYGYGRAISPNELAHRMLLLARRGAHNINCVTGTQYVPSIIEAVALARAEGLRLPIVWNTSGYETLETIDLLKGTVDIYLTDIKYADNEIAKRCSDAKGYFEIATRAAKHMMEQVGPLAVDEYGIGLRGVIIRHLVLPGGLAGTAEVMRFIAAELGSEVPVSLMGQYFPAFLAQRLGDLSRRLTSAEYKLAKSQVRQAGISAGWFQDFEEKCAFDSN